jgi:hypothetical protein
MADYRAETRRAAERYGLDPNIFAARSTRSRGSTRTPAVRRRRDRHRADHARDREGLGRRPARPDREPRRGGQEHGSLRQAVRLLRNALVAYNAGPGYVGKALPAETQKYLKIILGGSNPKAPKASTASAVKTVTTPGQTSTSTVTTGGDVTAPTLPARPAPTITGPALPGYVKNLPPTITVPDRSAPQASIRAAIAAIGNVPQTTTQATTTTPAQTSTTTTSAAPRASGGGQSGSKVLELIFNNGGKGYGIKDGQVVDGQSVFSAVWGGHANHVHVAAGAEDRRRARQGGATARSERRRRRPDRGRAGALERVHQPAPNLRLAGVRRCPGRPPRVRASVAPGSPRATVARPQRRADRRGGQRRRTSARSATTFSRTRTSTRARPSTRSGCRARASPPTPRRSISRSARSTSRSARRPTRRRPASRQTSTGSSSAASRCGT